MKQALKGKESVLKAFSFLADGQTQIGIEYQSNLYNFSLAWEIYKGLKNKGRGPELGFLQVMVEADFFNSETLQEVIFTLKKLRPLEDLKINNTIQYLPPIGRPQKILCIGRNYREHAAELNNPVPQEPVFFSKAISSLLNHEGKIRLPSKVGRVDFEGELAVVIGKVANHVGKQAAMDYVAGFSLLNDVTARDLQREDQKAGRPWFRSKSFDTFCPLGPFLVPSGAIRDYDTLELVVRVNGEVKQKKSASNMIFKLPEIIAYLSKHCTLQPGDIIATGTPSGVGELKKGDIVEVEVKEIGCLRNSVH